MFFEPPLAKIDRLQKQFVFLQQQQQISLRLRMAVEDKEKKSALRLEKIPKWEQQCKTEMQRFQKVSKEKTDLYRNIKGKYQQM